MKEPTEMPAAAKAKRLASKVKTRTSRKASNGKAPAKRSAGSAAKRSVPDAGYGDTAARFIARGKSAFGDAYAWAEETGSALPRSVRNLGLSNAAGVQSFIADRPLVLGAVGLGIGMALGAMLPSRIGYRPPDNIRRRPARVSKPRNT